MLVRPVEHLALLIRVEHKRVPGRRAPVEAPIAQHFGYGYPVASVFDPLDNSHELRIHSFCLIQGGRWGFRTQRPFCILGPMQGDEAYAEVLAELDLPTDYHHPQARFTLEQVARALLDTGGVLNDTARMLGTTRKVVRRYLDRFPVLENVRAEAKEITLDIAETGLREHVRKQNLTAIIFYLKTQGKARGYIERPREATATGGEMRPPDSKIIEVDLELIPADEAELPERTEDEGEFKLLPMGVANGPEQDQTGDELTPESAP